MRRHLARLMIIAAVLAASAGGSASAQYFGRNKVQYKHMDFQILKTEHFDIYFHAGEREGALISARLAERWYARLSQIFAHSLRGRQPLVLYASQAEFAQTNVIPDELSEGTGGVTEPARRRIVLPLAGPLVESDHVIGHELVHAFQFDVTTREGSAPGRSALNQLPLWFVEGMAEYIALGPVSVSTAMWLRDATLHNTLPSIDTLDEAKYFPYRWGHAFWAYVGGRWGDDVIRRMLTIAASGTVDGAIEKVLGVKSKELSADWQAAIRRACEPAVAASRHPEDDRATITGTAFGSELNIGPSLSPDGRRLAFLSSKSWFSIDLYVADATSGRVLRRLTSNATTPHFASLQFVYSAGGWDPSGRELAVATTVAGRATVAIFDVDSGRLEREIPLDDVDDIRNPAWAPDGRAVVFTGMRQGLTDLYIYDLDTSKVRRLTNDAYAKLQPVWSPDGRTIAFVTDQFSTNLSTLAIRPLQLAVIDVETGRITPIPSLPMGDDINPQWSPDGRSLYFVSSPDGIRNVFHVTLATGEIVQLTAVATGVSGITSASPALSVASRAGTLAFSVYDRDAYHIYVRTPQELLEREPTLLGNAALLPPADRRPSEIAALLSNPTLGLAGAADTSVSNYASTLALEGIGQPVIAVGASQFGAAFGGGVSMYFSDLLGNHILATAIQFSSFSGSFSAKDIAFQAGYFNRAHRWNWGIIGGQSPYLTAAFGSTIGVTTQGEPVRVDQTFIDRQTERSLSGVIAYPFNRSQRVEFSGGLTQISFEREVQTQAYSLFTGQRLVDDRTSQTLAPSLTLGSSSVAFVSDTASFGGTSPVQGERYRLEAAPSFGQLNFISMLADYRRYVMPAPFYTIAIRGIHYGRYGADAEDLRLSPLYLGYPTLVRGYDVNSFSPADCVPTSTSACPIFDRLVGSRLLVGNIELRFPLLRPFGTSRRMYGPIPAEVALFADGGVAWDRNQGPAILGGSRRGVSSTGVTVRINLGGYAVGQFDVVRPLQRPQEGWTFQFNLTPGF